MTNREKFEEVFGMKMDDHADDPCTIVDDIYCDCSRVLSKKPKPCDGCEVCHFWDKEYIGTSEDHEDMSKAFMLGALFVTVASRDQVVSMIIKMMEDMEVREYE